MNVQEKESLIIGTIINCNKEIQNYLNATSVKNKSMYSKLFESKYSDIYHYNMVSLYSDIMNIPVYDLNESYNFPTAVKNTNNNYYSYFKNVYSFLNGFEINIQKSLNESMQNSDDKHQINLTTDINGFKNTLKHLISKIEKIDDVNNYSDDILRIKIFSKQPLFIYGYDIVNNIALKNTLYEKYKITDNDLFSIVYSKLKKEIWFILTNKISMITYNIVENKFEEKTISNKLESQLYLNQLKQLFDDNTLLELYVNENLLNFKFTDNLYRDISTAMNFENFKQQSLFVK